MMKKTLKAVLVVISLPLFLSSCGTTPASNYYVLSADAMKVPSGTSPSLGVGPVEIPEYLNRNAMIFNRDDNKLHITSFDRWAEPLDSSTVRVLRLNLASLLDTQDVQSYPWSSKGRPEYGVDVTIINLEANDERARLVAEWHIRRTQSDQTMLRRINELYFDMPPGPVSADQLAPAYSELLLQLSKIIAQEISKDYAARSGTTGQE